MDALLFALTLGLVAGLSPGPLVTLVIQASLARGFGAGLRVALAPLLTDVPIVVIVLLVLDRLTASALSVLSLAGGLFVVAIGVATWRETPPDLDGVTSGQAGAGDVWRGVVVNALSPHPWLTWATVLGPKVVDLWRGERTIAVTFVAIFYLLLVGSKVLVAWAVARGRHLLAPGAYRWVLRTCAALLVGFGVLLLVDGSRGLL